MLWLAAMAFAAPVFAESVVNQRPLLFEFNGGDSSIGKFTGLGPIASDESTGDLYAIHETGSEKGPSPFDATRVVCKFNFAGEAESFSATGKSCLDPRETDMAQAFGVEGFFVLGSFRADVAIDNSGGAGGPGEGEQGRLYVSEESGPVHAFAPDGTWLWTTPSTSPGSCGVAVDRQGHLWVGNGEKDTKALEFDSEPPAASPLHTPPQQIASVTMARGSKRACRLAVDNTGKGLYAGMPSSGIPDGGGVDKYIDGLYDSTLTTEVPIDVTIDQSQQSGHIFTADGDHFAEYEPCGTLGCQLSEVPGSPFGGDLIGDAHGIAYNPDKDWVYVADRASNAVKVFGPRASGTVPDVTVGASDQIGRSFATVRGAVNPQSVPNSFRFEYKSGEGSSWAGGLSSSESCLEPPPPLPVDSIDHAVSCKLIGLKANAIYQVRLVGENVENGLKSYSAVDTFKTLPPPTARVEGCSVTAITDSSAHLACTIAPEEDETVWKVLRSPLPDASPGQCKELKEAQFSLIEEGTIPAEEPGAVPIAAELEGLQQAETSCVRVIATNGGGTSSLDLSFITTTHQPPTELAPAFVAPREDTAARLNGYLNPEGDATFSYHFELSPDGIQWAVLPTRESSANGREQVVVAEEVSGLTPGATYHYRLAGGENEAGVAVSPSGEQTFTTRSTAESTLPPNAFGEGEKRGIELVNNADKGVQNALPEGPLSATSPLSADGNLALWTVTAGAPGSNTGFAATFLAERGAGGWHSKSLVPSAAQQVGGGEFTYLLENATPDFLHFISQAASYDVRPQPPLTILRLDRSGTQEELAINNKENKSGLRADITDDAAHVLTISNETQQLEDIGSGVPKVISIMPGGSPSACGVNTFTAGEGAAGQNWRSSYHRMAQTDASRVYFEVKPDGKCASGHEGLYVRNRESGKTTLIDPGTSTSNAEIIRVTPDGGSVFFVTRSKLDSADLNAGADVYRWDEKGKVARCLTCVVSADASVGAGVGSEVLVSDDFSHIYFSSDKKLVPGHGKEGRANIYALSGEQLRFVGNATPANEESSLATERNSLLSADGNVFVYKANASRNLTADEVPAECPKVGGVGLGGASPCKELYLYDDLNGSTECLSCVRGGLTGHSIGTPNGSSGSTVDFKLSADGSTVAFATQEGLLRSDVNNDTDIYEWRNGSLRLITNGVSDFQEGPAAPQVAAVDHSGANILFSLVQRDLTGFESDGLVNVYNARLGGGFEPPAPSPHCTEDSCQGPLQAPPTQRQPSSTTSGGRGNETGQPSRRCVKGKARGRRRCVPHAPRHHRKKDKQVHRHKQGGHADTKQGRAAR